MSRHLTSESASSSPAAGTILRRWLSERIVANPGYSLRAMARRLGVSPGYMSQVLNGRKRLSTARAVHVAETLQLSDGDARTLLLAAALGKVPRFLASETDETGDFRVVELERFKALSHWYHVAILDLAETAGFRAQPAWIAKRLRISPVQAAEALERLQDLELLVEKNGKLRKANARVAVMAKSSRPAIREYHKQMIGKALDTLEDATPEAFAQRSVTGITMSVNPERLPETYTMIDQFRRKLERFLSEGEATEVYQLNVQLFNLSHALKTRSDS